jgi:hypothetical protein
VKRSPRHNGNAGWRNRLEPPISLSRFQPEKQRRSCRMPNGHSSKPSHLCSNPTLNDPWDCKPYSVLGKDPKTRGSTSTQTQENRSTTTAVRRLQRTRSIWTQASIADQPSRSFHQRQRIYPRRNNERPMSCNPTYFCKLT